MGSNPNQPAPMQPGDFTSATLSTVVTWQTKRVTPPSPLYVTVDDVLRVAAATSQTGEIVTVSYRLLRAADGKIVMGQDTIAPANNRVVVIQDIPLAEGFLLSVSCKAAVATTRGQTFVRLFLNPKALGSGQPGLMMMSDYVTTAMAPGYPNGRALAPTEGNGAIPSMAQVSLPIGTDWTFNVPTNARWRPMCISAVFVASGAAANRQPEIEYTSSGNTVCIIPGANSITAGQTVIVNWAPGLPFGIDSLPDISASLPFGAILGGAAPSTVQVRTVGLQAGDQWTAVRILVEEWLDNV